MPSTEETIQLYLKTLKEDVPAWKIAQDIGANRNTVRVYLKRLYDKGLIDKPKRGYYCNKPRYGVGEPQADLLRFQHLHFWVDEVKIRAEDAGREEVLPFPEVSGGDSARIRIEFGAKRGKINWYVKADAGLDFYGLHLARSLVDERLLRLGYKPPLDWRAEGWESLTDKFGLRLNGVTTVTFTTLSGWMEKYYNKRYGLRHEIRAPGEGDATLSQLGAMLQGGINYGQLIQAVAVTNKNQDRLLAYLDQQSRLLQAILEKLTRGK